MAFSSPCLTVLRFCIPTHTNKVVIKECYIPITEKTQNPQGPLKSPVCLPLIFCVPWAGPLLCFCFLSEQAIALLSQTPLLSLVTFCPILFSNWPINPLMTYSCFLILSPYFLPPTPYWVMIRPHAFYIFEASSPSLFVNVFVNLIRLNKKKQKKNVYLFICSFVC